MSSSPEKPLQVQVLHKTLDILEALKGDESGIGLAGISRSVGMPKPTVYRILTTLETRGYVDRRADGTYRMSEKLFTLQRDKSIEENLRLVAQPVMESLSKACRETVNLGTLDGGEVVVIATVESSQSIRMASKVGNRRCMHTTGLGKMLLSGLEEREIRRLAQLRGLPRLTGKSITTSAALLNEIRTVRRQGYAIDNQENELDGRCIAGPIFGQNEDLIAALSVSGPAFRMDLQRLRSFRSVLQESCSAISQRLQE